LRFLTNYWDFWPIIEIFGQLLRFLANYVTIMFLPILRFLANYFFDQFWDFNQSWNFRPIMWFQYFPPILAFINFFSTNLSEFWVLTITWNGFLVYFSRIAIIMRLTFANSNVLNLTILRFKIDIINGFHLQRAKKCHLVLWHVNPIIMHGTLNWRRK